MDETPNRRPKSFPFNQLTKHRAKCWRNKIKETKKAHVNAIVPGKWSMHSLQHLGFLFTLYSFLFISSAAWVHSVFPLPPKIVDLIFAGCQPTTFVGSLRSAVRTLNKTLWFNIYPLKFPHIIEIFMHQTHTHTRGEGIYMSAECVSSGRWTTLRWPTRNSYKIHFY